MDEAGALLPWSVITWKPSSVQPVLLHKGVCVCVCVCVCVQSKKGKAIPLQARCGPEGG